MKTNKAEVTIATVTAHIVKVTQDVRKKRMDPPRAKEACRSLQRLLQLFDADMQEARIKHAELRKVLSRRS